MSYDLLDKVRALSNEPMYKLKRYIYNPNRYSGYSFARLVRYNPTPEELKLLGPYAVDVFDYKDFERTYYEQYNAPDYEHIEVSPEVDWLAVKAVDEYEPRMLDAFLVYVQTGKRIKYNTKYCIHMHCMVGDWDKKELLCLAFKEKGAFLNVKKDSIK